VAANLVSCLRILQRLTHGACLLWWCGCRVMLQEEELDLEKAFDWLRKKGQASGLPWGGGGASETMKHAAWDVWPG
jgi:translation elongation factor EF-Ts